jgi:hypothetical protein
MCYKNRSRTPWRWREETPKVVEDAVKKIDLLLANERLSDCDWLTGRSSITQTTQTRGVPLSPRLDMSVASVKCAQKFTVKRDCHKLADNLDNFRSATGQTCATSHYNSFPNIHPLPPRPRVTSLFLLIHWRMSRTIRNAVEDSPPG